MKNKQGFDFAFNVFLRLRKFENLKACLNSHLKNYNASFMPVNIVFEFYTDKRSIDISCFWGDKRSI